MAEEPKTKRPLSDLARETRRNNALRLNEKRRQEKAAPKEPASTEEDPVVEMIKRIVDERLDEKLSESRSGSNLSAIALLGVQLLANSNLVPSLVARLSKKTETPSETRSDGLALWLDSS